MLADLHAVDPAAVGLADFGRPDGYLERQVRRWGKQLDAVAQPGLAGIDELQDRLAARHAGASPAAAIVHGDYRLDNVHRRPTTTASRRCSTGRWPPSATRSPTSGCC